MSYKIKSKGLGTSIEKITKATGIKKIVEAGAKALGKDCGCGKRRDFLDNPDLMVNKILTGHFFILPNGKKDLTAK